MDFDDLDKMLADMIKKIPSKKEELLDKVGNLLSEQVKSNIESRVNTSSDEHEKDKLIEDIEIVKGSGKGYVAVKPSWDKSHLNYLIENGHRIVKNDVVVGFVNGKHAYRDSIEQCSDDIKRLAEDMLNEVVKNE